MADKARSAFFKALLRVLSFPAVSTFSENLFARGGLLGPIGVFRVGPLHDRTGSGHPDDPDSSFFSLTQVAPSPNVGLGRWAGYQEMYQNNAILRPHRPGTIGYDTETDRRVRIPKVATLDLETISHKSRANS